MIAELDMDWAQEIFPGGRDVTLRNEGWQEGEASRGQALWVDLSCPW